LFEATEWEGRKFELLGVCFWISRITCKDISDATNLLAIESSYISVRHFFYEVIPMTIHQVFVSTA
jgi:hypothetical protein